MSIFYNTEFGSYELAYNGLPVNEKGEKAAKPFNEAG